jgi:hypothetical protein
VLKNRFFDYASWGRLDFSRSFVKETAGEDQLVEGEPLPIQTHIGHDTYPVAGCRFRSRTRL